MLSAAESLTEEKRRRAAEKASAEKMRIERERAAAREKYLEDLAQKADKTWLKVEGLISTKQPARYDEAVKLLVDLRDLAARRGKIEGFQSRYRELCQRHEKKPSLLRRVKIMSVAVRK